MDIAADRQTGNGIPADEAFPGYRERWEQERAQQAA
jgi:hypothetical protein